MKPVIFSLAILFILSSCKKTEVSGTVYSKNNYVVPNTSVSLTLYHENDSHHYSSESEVTTTDNNGGYYFSFKKKNRYNYYVTCISDSGKASSKIETGKPNSIDLHLQ